MFSFVRIRDRNEGYKEIPQMICEFAYELPSLAEWTEQRTAEPEKESTEETSEDSGLVGE